MEFFGLHIPHAFYQAVTVLYWIAVAVGLLACVMRKYLWGKWRWYLLALAGATAICAGWFTDSNAVFSFAFFAGLLLCFFKKWRKLEFSRMEYFLMILFAYPALIAFFLFAVVFHTDFLGRPL